MNTELTRAKAVLAVPSTKNEIANKMLMVSVVAGLMAAIPGSILFPVLAFLLVGGYLKFQA